MPVNSKAFAAILMCSNNSKNREVPKTRGDTQIILKDPTSNSAFKNFCFSSTISKQRDKEKVKFIKAANRATKSEFTAGRIKLSAGIEIFANPLRIITRMGKKMNAQKRTIKKESSQ